MMDYTDVKSPVWADAAQDSIACQVKFETLADYVPFMAMKSDPQAHGGEIFEACASGKYGVIGAYIPPQLTPDQQFAAAIEAGLTIASAAVPALNGTYGVSDDDISNIMAEAQFISLYQEFTNGQTTFPWADLGGQTHVFPDTVTFMAFAKATAQYVSACKQARVALKSGVADYPSNVIELE